MFGPHTLYHIISIKKQSAQPSLDNLGRVHRPFTGLVRTPFSAPAGQSYTDRTTEHQVTSSTLKMGSQSLQRCRIFTHRRACLAGKILLNFRKSFEKIQFSLKSDKNNEL
jgi:hypothetical protein